MFTTIELEVKKSQGWQDRWNEPSWNDFGPRPLEPAERTSRGSEDPVCAGHGTGPIRDATEGHWPYPQGPDCLVREQ